MNNSYVFNQPTQPILVSQQLFALPNMAYNVTFQTPQQHFYQPETPHLISVPYYFFPQATQNFGCSGETYSVNQNGPNYLAISPQNLVIQCVQTIQNPQGLNDSQLLEPNLLSVNPMCVSSIPSVSRSVQDFQQPQYFLNNLAQTMPKVIPEDTVKFTTEDSEPVGEGQTTEDTEDSSTMKNTSINSVFIGKEEQDQNENVDSLNTLAALTNSIQIKPNSTSNLLMQPIHLQTVPTYSQSQQIMYTNMGEQHLAQNPQSIQVLVPTPQGLTVQTLSAGYPNQLINGQPNVPVMSYRPSTAAPQAELIPETPSTAAAACASLSAPVQGGASPLVDLESVAKVESTGSSVHLTYPPNLPPTTSSDTMVSTVSTLIASNEINDMNAFSPLLPDFLDDSSQATVSQTTCSVVDGIDLEAIRKFSSTFKMRRLALGLTQSQVGASLTATEGPAYSQSAICRFEKLDLTPKSAAKIQPVLEHWLRQAEEQLQDGHVLDTDCQSFYPWTVHRKTRKRRTFFSNEALNVLTTFFEKKPLPSGRELNCIAEEIGIDRDTIRVWFANKRQSLRNPSPSAGRLLRRARRLVNRLKS